MPPLPSTTRMEPLNHTQARSPLPAPSSRTSAPTRWIIASALAYSAAMGQLALAYPEDTEAKIVYALALNATALPTDKSYANHRGVAHYIIHSNDVPALAQYGLDAALRYSEIAPAAPHCR